MAAVDGTRTNVHRVAERAAVPCTGGMCYLDHGLGNSDLGDGVTGIFHAATGCLASLFELHCSRNLER